MVAEILRGSNYRRERLKELGIEETRSPTSGNLGNRCIVVDTMPNPEERDPNAIYFIRA